MNQFNFFSCHTCDGLNCPVCSREHMGIPQLRKFKPLRTAWGEHARVGTSDEETQPGVQQRLSQAMEAMHCCSDKIKWQTLEKCGKYEYILQSKLFPGQN